MAEDTKPAAVCQSSLDESPVRDEKLAEFHRILQSVPDQEKLAYNRALARCPDLISLESNPLVFLRRHDFGVYKAVTAFLGYWQARSDVFGDTRAFLPLTLTGQGALTMEDKAALQAPCTTLLPEHQSGSPVVFIDHENAPTLRQDVVARTFFYVQAVAGLNPLAQIQGYYGLVRHSETWKQVSCGEGFRKGIVALESLPLKVRHLIVLVKPSEAQDAKDHILTMRQRYPVFVDFLILTIDDELIQKLEAQGFSRDGIPEYLGGDLPADRTVAWLEKFKDGFEGVDYNISSKSNVAAFVAANPTINGATKAEWGMRVLEETIHFMPDGEEKDAYLEALEVAPELVNSESNPWRFLKSVDYDGWAAARKLCKYWFYRKKWFGSKSLRPMTVNGKGALSPDDYQLIQRGFFQILPHDTNECPVFAVHSEGQPKGSAILRAFFYFMQKIAEDEASRTHGIVFLVHFVGANGHIDGAKWARGFDFAWNAAPTRIIKTWIVAQEGSISLSRGQALKQMFKSDPEVIELVDDPHQNMKRMAREHFSFAGTPTQLGGRWSQKDFIAWLDHQLQLEEDRDFSPYGDVTDHPLLESLPSDIKTIPSDTTEEMTLLVAMEQALKAMSDEDTYELKVARRECSNLFAAESPPLRFLRVVEFDPLKAAHTLAQYWKARCNVFGRRAFLPLHLSKQSALDEKAVRIVKAGEMALLPEDKAGRPVLVIFREPAHGKRCAIDADLQAFFYLLQVASENPRSQTEGVVAIRQWVPSLFTSSRFNDFLEVCSSALPVRFYSHHLVCPIPPSGQPSYLESLTSKIYSFSKHFMSGTIQVHLMGDKDELQKELLSFDLSPSCLPKCVGGHWDKKIDMLAWLGHRTSRESKIARRLFPEGIPDEDPNEPVPETAQSIEKALEALEEAINLMSDDDKADYLEAKRVVPYLVQKESNPLWFIRCEKWNTWAAARRVALYWKKRVEYFGKRAHLPLNQSGEGALSKEDVALLSTGYCCLLPRDSRGRDVICHDATRKPPGMVERRMRVLFYIGGMLAENRKNQTEGSRLLMILSKISLDGGISKTMELAKEILPSLTYDVHIIHVPGESSKTTFIDKLVPSMLKILGSFLEQKTKIYANESKASLLEHLEAADFNRAGIPSTVGGTWTYDQFYYWQEARIRMEWDLPLSAAQRKLVFEGDKYTCRGLSELNEEEKVERKRRLNLLHSRRKREKEKVEIEVLKSQVARLEDRKHEAEMENDRLQKLLNRAQILVGGSTHWRQAQQLFASREAAPGIFSRGGVAMHNLTGALPLLDTMNPQSPDTAHFTSFTAPGSNLNNPGANLGAQLQAFGRSPRISSVGPASALNYSIQAVGQPVAVSMSGGSYVLATANTPQHQQQSFLQEPSRGDGHSLPPGFEWDGNQAAKRRRF